MDTLTKNASSPSTARLRNTLTELTTLLEQTTYEVSNLESEFQHLVVQAMEEAEAATHKQSQERLVQTVAEAERVTRAVVSEELKAQFARELSRTEAARNELIAEREELQRAIQHLTEAAKDQQEQTAHLKEERDRALQAVAEVKQSFQREVADRDRALQALTEAKQSFQREVAERDRAVQALTEAKQSFQRELADMEDAAAIALERQIATTVERVRSEIAGEGDSLQTKLGELTQASEQWNAERAQLTADLEQARRLIAAAEAEHSRSLSETRRAAAAAFERQMDRVRSELTDECDRLRQEVEQLARSAAQWNTERNHLNGELERANRLLAEAKAGTRPPDLSAPTPVPSLPPVNANGSLQAEITRVEGQIKAITQIIDDPATELSVVFRKNSERGELESYLKGIRFLIGK